MRELSGKVAVVTGAASGIGRGLADRFASEGMCVVLADVEAEALTQAERELADAGHEVLAHRTDVSDPASVEALAAAVYDRFGSTHVVCNNAGVAGGMGALWETTEEDWSWVIGVNLMGVVHGIRAFVPRMLAGGEEGHIVNTSSVLGLSTGGGSIYSVSKHAVARLTEGLHYDLAAAGAPIGVSLLCPGLIATRIVNADRNRPEHLRNPVDEATAREREQMRAQAEQYFLDRGMPPAEVAQLTLDAIREGRFYVFTHDWIAGTAEQRLRGILEGRLPEDPGGSLAAVVAREQAAEPARSD